MNTNNNLSEYNESNSENLVEDLKESLKNTIDETKHILDALEQTIETTIKDKSISGETKKIVDSTIMKIKNSTTGESENTTNSFHHSKDFNNLEEE